MKLSTLYRRAAERIAISRNTVCCAAISDALWEEYGYSKKTTNEFLKARDVLESIYAEHDESSWGRWWAYPDDESRMFALLLAAEITKRGLPRWLRQ
jgi:hypothetical protein